MKSAITKSLYPNLLRSAACAALLMLAFSASVRAQGARLDIATLEHLGTKASQTIDVNIDERLMQLTAKILTTKDPDEAKVKQLVNGLKGIYVKSFEFERDGEYSPTDLASIRTQLGNPVWSRIVNVTSKREGSIEVYLMMNGAQIGGLAVLATQPKELTIVNIIGPVDLEKLSLLEGQFGIPELELEQPKPKQKN